MRRGGLGAGTQRAGVPSGARGGPVPHHSDPLPHHSDPMRTQEGRGAGDHRACLGVRLDSAGNGQRRLPACGRCQWHRGPLRSGVLLAALVSCALSHVVCPRGGAQQVSTHGLSTQALPYPTACRPHPTACGGRGDRPCALAHRVCRSRATGSVGDSVGEGPSAPPRYRKEVILGGGLLKRGDTRRLHRLLVRAHTQPAETTAARLKHLRGTGSVGDSVGEGTNSFQESRARSCLGK